MLTDFTDNNETVMFAPATGFYSSPGYGKKQIRIGFVLNEQKLLRATEILEKALKTYSNWFEFSILYLPKIGVEKHWTT